MARYSSKYELLKISDSEIIEFFKSARFTGVFDLDIPDELKTNFCGKVTDIEIEGEKNGLCLQYLYIPIKFQTYVHPGSCEFHCAVNIAMLREEKHVFRLFVQRISNIEVKEISPSESLFRRNLKLRNNFFIGQFTRNIDGSFSIRDIR